jgi:hypothetical protein
MSHALEASSPSAPAVDNRPSHHLCCSFCRTELGGDASLAISASRAHGLCSPASYFCSTHCRDCVLALAGLHPSPLASKDFITRRTLLTDRLLELWRSGAGPDPALVLQAALRADSGLAAGGAHQPAD